MPARIKTGLRTWGEGTRTESKTALGTTRTMATTPRGATLQLVSNQYPHEPKCSTRSPVRAHPGRGRPLRHTAASNCHLLQPSDPRLKIADRLVVTLLGRRTTAPIRRLQLLAVEAASPTAGPRHRVRGKPALVSGGRRRSTRTTPTTTAARSRGATCGLRSSHATNAVAKFPLYGSKRTAATEQAEERFGAVIRAAYRRRYVERSRHTWLTGQSPTSHARPGSTGKLAWCPFPNCGHPHERTEHQACLCDISSCRHAGGGRPRRDPRSCSANPPWRRWQRLNVPRPISASGGVVD